MSWSVGLICALVAGGVGYLSLAGFVWANRQSVGSRPLAMMLLSVKVWSLCYALELSSHTVAVAQWWSALKYVGIVTLPPLLWSFVLAYTGRGQLSRRNRVLLLIHPVVAMTLLILPIVVPGVPHYLLLQEYQNPPDHLLGAPVPGTAPPLFWVHAVYVYVLMLAADFVLFARLTRIARPYRRQGALLIAASLLPCIGNIAYNAGLLNDGLIDPTPFLFGITAVVLVWGFFRLRLLDLSPVARGIVIEQMADGVLVLDVYGRVADVNMAGAAMVGYTRGSMVGRYATDVVPGLAAVLERGDLEPGAGTVEDEVLVYPAPQPERFARAIGEIPKLAASRQLPDRVPAGARSSRGTRKTWNTLLEVTGSASVDDDTPQIVVGPPRDIAVSLTWVTDQVGRPIARLVVLRDVTERNRTERQLRDLLDEQTKLSDTLRQSLLPSSLPQLPGLRLAARSVPSARGGGVGGDFYDVHSVNDDVSAFVLGDVSGKGVHAAVVTSMARYTVRTLSAQGWPPREVLQQLNRVLQSPDDPERFCTVVYAQVRQRAAEQPNASTDGSGGVRLILTLGGHPPPLLRRRDRSVHSVGRPGTVLGLLPTIEAYEVTVDLAAGDVLLAYTDGVTEARRGDELFGEERLADVLAGVEDNFGSLSVEEYRAGQLADAVADAVLRAVTLFSSERDDVALLVLAAT
ncbi:MAG TPA: histidine kinase N-terminal 7TM domain-containing protein [Kineosporiaceae bacterium]|nr:histidine kinase N-terminal 7TM domain-containing protein [Kineosporiaceae bacterium]